MEKRWYQDDAVSAFFYFFTVNKSGNPVIAMPTGTGKSFVIARICKQALEWYPGTRIMMLTHVKELISQNAGKLRQIWPEVPLGIYSAGLDQRDTVLPITYAGVQSVYKQENKFPVPDLILVDEGHMVPGAGMGRYAHIFNAFRERNPKLRIACFSATPYRMGQGKLTDSGVFTDMAYDITGMEAFNRLIYEGYLVPPFNRPTRTEYDVRELSIKGDDYNQTELERAVDTDPLNQAICEEFVAACMDRVSWCIFASGIKHAEHLTEIIRRMGISCEVVHSKKTGKHNDKAIEDWQNFKIRCLVNYGKLTTGIDHPALDAIGMMRPTMSTSLWVQMLGRGTRPSPATDKRNCLVLDFARNTPRLGPINDPNIPRAKGAGGGTGDAPVRICDNCGVYNPASARTCFACGCEFSFAVKLTPQWSEDEIIRTDAAVVEWFSVDYINYRKHNKPGMPTSLRIDYGCNGYVEGSKVRKTFTEWIHPEHRGAPRAKAKQWWLERFPFASDVPATVDELLTYEKQLKVPKRLRIHINKKYPEILGYEY